MVAHLDATSFLISFFFITELISKVLFLHADYLYNTPLSSFTVSVSLCSLRPYLGPSHLQHGLHLQVKEVTFCQGDPKHGLVIEPHRVFFYTCSICLFVYTCNRSEEARRGLNIIRSVPQTLCFYSSASHPSLWSPETDLLPNTIHVYSRLLMTDLFLNTQWFQLDASRYLWIKNLKYFRDTLYCRYMKLFVWITSKI